MPHIPRAFEPQVQVLIPFFIKSIDSNQLTILVYTAPPSVTGWVLGEIVTADGPGSALLA